MIRNDISFSPIPYDLFHPVLEHHHPLRPNGPLERLGLPGVPLEALWWDARLCSCRLAATGVWSLAWMEIWLIIIFLVGSVLNPQVCDSLGLVYFSIDTSTAYAACIFGRLEDQNNWLDEIMRMIEEMVYMKNIPQKVPSLLNQIFSSTLKI